MEDPHRHRAPLLVRCILCGETNLFQGERARAFHASSTARRCSRPACRGWVVPRHVACDCVGPPPRSCGPRHGRAGPVGGLAPAAINLVGVARRSYVGELGACIPLPGHH